MKVYLISLGCAKNRVDSEVIIGNLVANEKVEITFDMGSADLIIINTCAFIESAKEEAINTIFEVLDTKKKRQKVMVCGCLATRYKDEINELIPEVDRFVSIKEYPNLKEIVNDMFKSKPFVKDVSTLNRMITGMKESVYVKISEGCNNRCSYCAIPLIRGSFVSRSMDEIVEEVKGLIANGAYEINLISQDTTNYGIDLYKEYKIVELLKRVTELEGNFKVRLLYLYPSLVSDALIDFIAGCDKVYPYFDIPLQHSETKILKSMNRRGDKEFIINLLNKIRTKIPHAILRTTMIVGFPGEEEEDFNNLVEFIKEMKFDRLGAFSYSPEEDTVGATMPNQIDSNVKEARLSALYLAQDMIAEEANSKQIGTVSEVLIVDYDADSYAYIGRNYAFAPDDIDGFIFVYSANELKIGDVVKVKILDASINTLSGEVIFDEA